jgi:hypothetical protein
MNVEKYERVIELHKRLESAKEACERESVCWSDEVASLARERILSLAPLHGWPADDDTLTEVVLEGDHLRVSSTTVSGHDGGDYWLPLAWWAMSVEEWNHHIGMLHLWPSFAKAALQDLKTGPTRRRVEIRDDAVARTIDEVVEEATRLFRIRIETIARLGLIRRI